MFGFVKQILISTMVFFSCILLSVRSLKCILTNNQECKSRPQFVNINSKVLIFSL